MSSPRVVSFRIDPEKVAQLDKLAKAMDRDRSYLINEAVENYIAEQTRFVAMVQEGLDDMASGRFYTHEQVEQMADEWANENLNKVQRTA